MELKYDVTCILIGGSGDNITDDKLHKVCTQFSSLHSFGNFMALSVINKSTDNRKLYLPENCKPNRQVGQIFVFCLTAHVSFMRLYPIDNGQEPIRNVNSGILLAGSSRVLKMASVCLFC